VHKLVTGAIPIGILDQLQVLGFEGIQLILILLAKDVSAAVLVPIVGLANPIVVGLDCLHNTSIILI
jgi:hypothetical protein